MLVLGIDEVGRGCLAGPLVVGAVALSTPIDGLKDSKLLSAKRRRHYDQLIKESAEYIGLGWVAASELDAIGLSKALKLACERAVMKLELTPDDTVIDGNINFLSGKFNSRTLIKADNLINAVSAASIVAKVARDEYMKFQAQAYPDYFFDTNVGYGSKTHIEAILSRGICPLHRRSFEPVKTILLGQNSASTAHDPVLSTTLAR
jgi:ribonuclease HII